MKKKENCSIRTNKKSNRDLLSNLKEEYRYSGRLFGLPASLTGKGVKICVIDSGEPDHVDIKKTIEVVDFRSSSSKDKKDRHGHSTMIGGILSSNNPRAVKGICPDADILYAKVADSTGECCHESIVSAILWGIIKKADIILISLGSTIDYPILRDAISKAERSSICVVAAGSNNGDVEYPSSYPTVLSVGKSKIYKKQKSFKYTKETGIEMILPDHPMYTTYLGGKYTTASGTSLNAAIAAGLLSLLIEKYSKSSSPIPDPQTLYSEVGSLAYNITVKK